MQFITITRNNDFLRAYRRGKSFVHPFVVTYVVRRRGGGPVRVGITTSKKVGGAVQRNRARRVLRAALAQVLPANATGFDIVLVARNTTPAQKSTRLAPVLQKHLRAGGVLAP